MKRSIPYNPDQCVFDFDVLSNQPVETLTIDTSYAVDALSKMKRCGSCKNLKPKNHETFGRDTRTKDGFRNACKDCRREERERALERDPDLEKKRWQKRKDEPRYKSFEDHEHAKLQKAKHMREWKNKNIESGMCAQCGVNPSEPGKHCADCREYGREWHKQNGDRYAAVSKKERDRLREDVLNAYGNKCTCCGEAQQEFLAIDHINNDGKEHRKEIGGGALMYRWLRNHGYPQDRFQILCHNCNFAKFRYGICPHQSKSS